MKNTVKTVILSAALALATVSTQANAATKSNLIVQPLASGSAYAETQADTQDLLLHNGDNGDTYLYVEQQQGAVLSVYNVTDPAHIKLDASIRTEAHGSYDFVDAIGDRELISFRDGSGSAVLDLRKPTAPRLALVDAPAAGSTEVLGTSGYLATTIQKTPVVGLQTRSVQVVETTGSPRLLATIPSVTRQVARPETGTTFLLGENGVTVVRRVDVEREYALRQALWNTAN